MIKSIELVNWKTHKHTVMNFQKGVNVLIGVMGAGKSSVIDGISFGLFGTFPKLNHKRSTLEELISNRPEIKDDAEVRIRFTIGDDEYVATRKINKKESTASRLEKNGRYLQTQTARVNEEIESLIKVDYDTFSRAIYAEQNRLDYFLEITKSERKKQIDEMLGLDSFAKAEENTTSLINSIRSLISDEEQMLAQIDRQELKQQFEKLTKERQDLAKEQGALSGQAKEKETSVKGLGKELDEIKDKSERSRRLSREIVELSSRIETLKGELKGIEPEGIDRLGVESKHDSLRKRVQEYEVELKAQRKEESSINRELAEAEASIRLNQRRIEERDRLLESIKGRVLEAIEKETDVLQSKLQDALKEISSLKGRKEELREWTDELSRHLSRCPVCERELDDVTRNMLLGQKKSSLREIDANITKLQSDAERLEKELGSSRKELEKVRLATSKLADYKGVEELVSKGTSLVDGHRGRHGKVVDLIDRHINEIESLNREISSLALRLDAIRRKEKYESEIKESSAILERLRSEMKGLNFDEKSLYALQELITKESSALTDIRSKLKSNERYIISIESQIDERAKSLAGMNAIADRVEARRNLIGNMNKFRSALVDTETQLRNNLVTSINALMQNIWSEMYPYADYTGIRLNARKDDYALEASTGIDDNGARTWIEMDGIASGGERSTACLAMRIALAMVIVPNLRWLILDEPTHNIDENGIGKFMEILGGSLPNVVEQIFIITHDSALKNISSARVYQLERDKDKSEYTSVVEV